MRRPSTRATFQLAVAALATAACFALPAQAAGTVEVSYIQPEKFIDIGFGNYDRERNQASLNESFQRLARLLPDGQALKIEVLDVDLAGELKPGSARDIRIVRGGADWPRIKLRYSLQAGNTTLKAGEDNLADMNYLFSQRTIIARDGGLPYEQRLINRWFTETFASPQP